MDREHYWILANALATQPNTPVKYETLLELCQLLKVANPKFDTDRFLDASEGEGNEHLISGTQTGENVGQKPTVHRST